jgi:glycosyltransferase involved in cell wall biosynthesis
VRILYVVQRYGVEVLGGAEKLCREFATRMAARGHQVEVAASCATDYDGWLNVYPPGESNEDGVIVHRFATLEERPLGPFLYLMERVHGAALLGRPFPAIAEKHWLNVVGPTMPEFAPWLESNLDRFDLVVIVTYQFAHAVTAAEVIGARRKSGKPTPRVLVQPTAHEDVTFGFSVFTPVFAVADGFSFLTEEEAEIVELRHGRVTESAWRETTGMGVDAPRTVPVDVLARLRQQLQLGDDPYVVAVGRLDPSKGFREVAEQFADYKHRYPGPLRLVVVGGGEIPSEIDPAEVRFAGRLSDDDLTAAFHGATALLHPSLYESFSLVVAEAWWHGLPVLVRQECAVLAGQCQRSQGGFAYLGFPEFCVMLETITREPQIAARLGANGRSYVAHRYQWVDVIQSYESLCTRIVSLELFPVTRGMVSP